MIVYLDTSVVLRILFGEANPVSVWRKWDKAYSSALWRIEALRTIDRMRLTHEITDNGGSSSRAGGSNHSRDVGHLSDG